MRKKVNIGIPKNVLNARLLITLTSLLSEVFRVLVSSRAYCKPRSAEPWPSGSAEAPRRAPSSQCGIEGDPLVPPPQKLRLSVFRTSDAGRLSGSLRVSGQINSTASRVQDRRTFARLSPAFGIG